jgi:transposase
VEEPQEVQDEEHERVYERVAAVDVAKASGVVCTRVPDESRPGRRRTRVWTVTATRNARLDEITGCGTIAAQAIIAEIGLDMTVFGTPGRLVSWAKRCPQTRQSGKKTSGGKAGKGNRWLNGILGEIAASAARTDTFLGERYRRIARRRGKRKAMVAVARSILVIIFCLLSDRSARFCDLGPDFYDTQINRDRKIRNHIRQLQALGIAPDDLAAFLTKNPPAA